MKLKQMLSGALLVASMATPALAQELPRGKWWRRPDIEKRLALTDEQQRKLDAISRGATNELIDAKAAMEKAAVALRDALDQQDVRREPIQKLATQLTEARGKLFERELMMLVDMRGVLTAEQWSRVREQLSQERGPRMRTRDERGRAMPRRPPDPRRAPAPPPPPAPRP